ncbi:Ig-like domain-containing protein, partial [Alysiella filiformis]|uniref:Ig-like domain-containing protein n=1 Tax=Alysiella filiformis TaxID=194196 RepID=UPI0015CED028
MSIHEIQPIHSRNQSGSTKLSGSLNVQNEGDDIAVAVTVQFGEQKLVANVAQDKKTWSLVVQNEDLAYAQGNPKVSVFASVSRDGATAETSSTSRHYQVDTKLSEPEIVVVQGLPDMTQGLIADEYTLSGSLNGVDTDVVRTDVWAQINGKPHHAKVTGNTWTLTLPSSELNTNVGEGSLNLHVQVQDKAGNVRDGKVFTEHYTVAAAKPTAEAYEPEIQITHVEVVNQENIKDGVIRIAGKSVVHNADSALHQDMIAVEVQVNDQTFAATAKSDLFGTWEVAIPEAVITQKQGDNSMKAIMRLSAPANKEADSTVAFKVDTHISAPTVTLDEVPQIINQKSLENQDITLRGTVSNPDNDIQSHQVEVDIAGVKRLAQVEGNQWHLTVGTQDLAKQQGENQISVKAIATDMMGNSKASEWLSRTYVVDTKITAPDVLLWSEPIVVNTNKARYPVVLSGSLNHVDTESQKVEVWVKHNDGTAQKAQLDGNTWTYNLPALGDNAQQGTHQVQVYATASDAAGNTATSATATGTFHVDTILHTPLITIDPVPDINQSQVNQTYVIQGKVTERGEETFGKIIQVRINDKTYTADLVGERWSVQVSGSDLASKVGKNTVLAWLEQYHDAAGNSANGSALTYNAEYNVIADTAPPATPVVPVQPLNKPEIGFNPINLINKEALAGKTLLSGSLNLNNTDLSNVEIEVLVGKGHKANIAPDQKSWHLLIDNSELAQQQGDITARVRVSIVGNNGLIERTTAHAKYHVDTEIRTPAVDLAPPLHNLNQDDVAKAHTLSGSLYDLDDDLQNKTVELTLNGQAIDAPIAINGNKWHVDLSGRQLTAQQGSNTLAVKATVTDDAGNRATSKVFEHTYQVDTDLAKPTVQIKPITVINQSKAEQMQTISGSINGLQEDARAEISVAINDTGTPKIATWKDRNTWEIKLSGSELASQQGQNTLNIQTQVSDNAGNRLTMNDTATYTVDTRIGIPQVQVQTADFKKSALGESYTISGSIVGMDEGDTVSSLAVVVNGYIVESQNVKVQGNTWTASNIPTTSLFVPDEHTATMPNEITLSVHTRDEAGNESGGTVAHVINVINDGYNSPLNQPSIGLNDIATINANNLSGKTLLSGSLNLNNSHLNKREIIIKVGETTHKLTVEEGATSWSYELPNRELAKVQGNNSIQVDIHLSKNDVTAHNSTSKTYLVDTQLAVPVLEISDIARINQAALDKPQILSGKIIADADANHEVWVSINGGAARPAQVNGNVWTLAGLTGRDLVGNQGENRISLTATSRDEAGNVQTATPVHKTYLVDTEIAEPIIKVDNITHDNIINIKEAANSAITVSGSVQNARHGDKVVVRVGEQDFETTVQNGKFSLAVNAKMLAERSDITVSVTATDDADNSREGSLKHVYQVNVQEPNITLKLNDIAIINQQSPNQIAVSGSIAGLDSGETIVGNVVKLTLNGKTHNATVTGNTFSANIAKTEFALGDTIRAEASVRNGAENESTANTSGSYVYDVSAPTPTVSIGEIGTQYTVNASLKQQASVALHGTVDYPSDVLEQAVKVVLTLNGQTINATVAGKTWTANVAGSQLAAQEGANTLTAQVRVTDQAGNTGEGNNVAHFRVITQIAAPVIQVDNITNDNIINAQEAQSGTITVSGSVQNARNNDKVVLSVGGQDFTGSVQNGKFNIGVDA